MLHSLPVQRQTSRTALLLCTAMALAGSLWAQSTEAERTSIVYGKVLDAFDGLPLPGLVVLDMTPDYERALSLIHISEPTRPY